MLTTLVTHSEIMELLEQFTSIKLLTFPNYAHKLSKFQRDVVEISFVGALCQNDYIIIIAILSLNMDVQAAIIAKVRINF